MAPNSQPAAGSGGRGGDGGEEVEMVSFFSTETDWKAEAEQIAENSPGDVRYRLKKALLVTSPKTKVAFGIVVCLVLALCISSMVGTGSSKGKHQHQQDWKSTVLFKKVALPPTTIQRIDDDPTCVQAKAYHWLTNSHDPPTLIFMETRKLQQLYAMAILHFAMNGDNWYMPRVPGADVCKWTGIACWRGDVTNLKVYPWQLQKDRGGKMTPGFVPPEVMELLPGLQSIFIKGYPVLGTLDQVLPTEITTLAPTLRELIIRECTITGSIPSFLGELTGLSSLDLSKNKKLAGQLHLEYWLQTLPSLRHVRLNDNQLRGNLTIPIIDFDENSFLNPGYSLVELQLENNQLTGPIPSELGLLTGLSLLEMGWNRFGGTIPTQLGLLRRIGTLDLSHLPKIVGTIPTQLGSFPSLHRLQLDFSKQIGGTIPSQLGLLTKAYRVDLAYTNLTGETIPSELHNIPGVFCLENTTLEEFGTGCEHDGW